uniref:Claudin-11-like n=1 Tax=Saccoglossus kowalevskii TaxID=10224 RepID=A0ABM0MVT9_SACKO|nr:PREDICTED: claudin-11-like [Saccoglossus kowalevskii]
MALRHSVVRLVGIVLLVLAMVALPAAVASDNWFTACVHAQNGKTAKIGLWGMCVYEDNIGDDAPTLPCFDFTSVPDYISACRALMVLSCICAVASFVSAFIGLIKDDVLLRVAGSFLIIASILSFIAIIVFPVKFEYHLDDHGHLEDIRLRWGMYVAITGCVLSSITAVLMFVGSVRRSSHKGAVWNKPEYLPEEAQTLLIQSNFY